MVQICENIIKIVCLLFDKLQLCSIIYVLRLLLKGGISMSHMKASLPVIRRLPRYYRYITELKNNGTVRI
ncbi:MAG: hypothetical protein J6Q18_01310, partial [Oscillospiraceae bacterium]|nr:hypothetical protein [Oscillospiraceae bacterium]